MQDPLFDVYLTGAKDASPSAQMRLTATIAARYRLPAPAVAEALIEGGRYRIAGRLPGREAQALVEALGELGAIAQRSPAGTPLTGDRRGADDSIPPGHQDPGVTMESADPQTPPEIVDRSEPMEFADPGPDGRTGARGPDVIRCPVHGLAYNRRHASGCARCLAPARARAATMEAALPTGSHRGGGFAGSPVRRAFWGLTLALVLGFLPAAYYARGSNRQELIALRARQAEIAAAPATKASLARFDDLDAAVNAEHLRGAGRTLLIWLAVAGLTGVTWTKLT